MSYLTVEQMRRAGLSPSSWISGMGRAPALQGDPGKISAASQSIEAAYAQIRSFGDQVAQLQAELTSLAASVGDVGVKSLADDAQLIGTSSGQKLARAKSVYGLEEAWVSQAVGQNVHGGWGFGRDVVIGQSLGDTSKNISGRPLDAWNRQQILQAAADELAQIQSALARDLGTIRSAREDALQRAQTWRAQSQAQAAKQQAVEQQSAFEQRLLDDARAREQEKLLRQQQLDQQRQQQQEAIEAQRAQLEQERLQRQQQLEIQREQMAQQLEQARLQAEQQRLAAQLQAEAQRAQLEQASLQQQIALEQQQQQQSFALEQQRAQALVQAELAQFQPQPQAYFPTAGGYGPGIAPATGSFPTGTPPPAWPAYDQAALWGASSGSVPEYARQGAVPFDTFASGGGFSGMGAVATTSPFKAGASSAYKPAPSAFSQVLTALPGLVTSGGQAASSILLARKGQQQLPGETQLQPSGGSGGGLGSLLPVLVGGGVILWFLSRSGGSKGGKKKRSY